MDAGQAKKTEYKYDGCDWESATSAVMGMLDLCGCVDDEIEDDIIHMLDCIINPIGYAQNSEDNFFYYNPDSKEEHKWCDRRYGSLILLMLDAAGLIEHGTSYRGSWMDCTDEQMGLIKNAINERKLKQGEI